MKKLLCLIICLWACGPAQEVQKPVQVVNLGTLEQPIYMPGGYGVELGGAQSQCAPPWDGNGCAVPDNKVIKVKLFTETCSSWWRARYTEVLAEMDALLDELGDDWDLVQVSSNQNYALYCGTTSGYGSFSFSTGNSHQHSTPFGKLYQHRKGTVILDSADITGHHRWGESDENNQHFAENVLRAEFFHVVGHGHSSAAAGPDVMQLPDDSWWEEDKWLTPEMYDRMRCYNEDSGHSPDC